MNCRTCGYSLWNLRERTCPECGSAFLPSEFTFIPNAVRFCCPHCNQDYYGTGESGHLVPRTYTCIRCANPVDMDQMVLLPTEGVREENTRGLEMPWLDRTPQSGRIGKRGFRTVLLALGSPGRLMQALPKQPRAGDAVLFAFLCFLLHVTIAGGPVLLFMLAVAGGVASFFSAVLMILVYTLILLGVIFAWAGLAHLILRLTGPTRLGYKRTVEAMSYSSSANLIASIPCLAMYIAPLGWIWWVISATFMVREGQGVSGKRASLAVITPALVVAASIISLIAFWLIPTFSTAVQQAQAAAARAGTLNQMRATTIAQALKADAFSRGEWPSILESIAAGTVPAQYLKTGGELTTDVVIAGESVDQLQMLSGQKQQDSLQRMLDSMPPDIAAYRIADYIFTYPGMDPRQADGDLWIFVAEDRMPAVAAPGQPPPVPGMRFWLVGKHNGTIERIADRDFDAAFAEQNALRTLEGLPELPHPDQIDAYWPDASDR